MNEVTIKGEVVFVDEVREYGANGFRKHQIVVETGDGNGQTPFQSNLLKIQLILVKIYKKDKK